MLYDIEMMRRHISCSYFSPSLCSVRLSPIPLHSNVSPSLPISLPSRLSIPTFYPNLSLPLLQLSPFLISLSCSLVPELRLYLYSFLTYFRRLPLSHDLTFSILQHWTEIKTSKCRLLKSIRFSFNSNKNEHVDLTR